MSDSHHIESIALTLDHGIGLRAPDDPERIATLALARQLYEHHVKQPLHGLWETLDDQGDVLAKSQVENQRLRRGLDWSCGLWTEHRINSRDEGFADYRDSPPTSSLLCALGPGTVIVETSDPGEPCAHVLRYVGSLPILQLHHAALSDDDWPVWLSRWKTFTAGNSVANAAELQDLGVRN